ncbi:MAG: hypothetical protein WC759_04980 [Candidatus Micrarchaeia archaeon]
MSIEALATLVMALGALALIYASAGGGASSVAGLASEMQAHDVAWVASYGVQGEAQMQWLADGLGACIEEAGTRMGRACGTGSGDAYSASYVSVVNGRYLELQVKLEKH